MNNQEEYKKLIEEYIQEEIEKIINLNILLDKQLREKEELKEIDL